ncbi:MAG: glycosyltransferase 87 family protein [Cyclobacteriaceae bacterium]
METEQGNAVRLNLANRWLLSIVLISLFSLYTFVVERHEGYFLVGGYCLCFMIYLYVLQRGQNQSHWMITGVLLRLILFAGLPVLSDDYFRFIWDGRLLNAGFNPFEELPAYYLDKGISGVDLSLYEQLNSPEYFTIYPPLNQLVFYIATWLSPESVAGAVAVMRLFVFSADIGNYILLKRLARHYQLSEKVALIYFLNPLVILEFTGNLHFESVMIFFILLFIYLFEKKKTYLSAVAIGMAIIAKLLPIMYLPSILKFRPLKKTILFYLITGAFVLLAFVPLLSAEFIEGLGSSLDLYFRKFEFNASFYFIFRSVGFAITGYNEIARIGPFLGLLTILLIVWYLTRIRKRNVSLPVIILTIHLIYLLFATTVHPWYITTLVALTALTGYRFAILWSFTIFMTYLGYQISGFSLPDWVLYLEYGTLFPLVVYELFFEKPLRTEFLSKNNSQSAENT